METRSIPAQFDPDRAPHRPSDHTPAAPAWSALTSGTVVYAQFGVQQGPEILDRLLEAAAHGTDAVDRAVHVDAAGVRNDIVMAYWRSPERYAAWDGHGLFEDLPDGDAGLWREVLTIPAERFETLHSTDRGGQGVSSFCPIHSTAVHEYNGGARDRIAASHTESLAASEDALHRSPPDTRGRRIVASAPDNVCFIRTAQDWSHCGDAERATYLEDVAPVLERGASFLRDHPLETGCITGRFVRELAPDGTPLDKTCFLAFFLSLGHLERWTWTHDTHAAIFGSFMQLVAKHNFAIDLALWHEVCVLPGDALQLEYLNCHPDTGFLPFFA